MGYDCANCGQPEPFEYSQEENPLAVADREAVSLKADVQKHIKDANDLEHRLGIAEQSLKRAEGERDSLEKAHQCRLLEIEAERKEHEMELTEERDKLDNSLADWKIMRDERDQMKGVLEEVEEILGVVRNDAIEAREGRWFQLHDAARQCAALTSDGEGEKP